jgi:hypothetical protein
MLRGQQFRVRNQQTPVVMALRIWLARGKNDLRCLGGSTEINEMSGPWSAWVLQNVPLEGLLILFIYPSEEPRSLRAVLEG